MYVRFWGTRGSIAAPGPATARYGGNTSCVEVRSEGGTVIVLDCGTGARALGLHLARTMHPLRLHLFIGHTHWDHIQGFPFFVPAFLPGAELNIYAPVGFQRGLEDAMAGQMEYSYFPVKLRDLRSRIHFTELDEGFFRVGDVLVETQYLNHTAPTIAYRMSTDGATLAYATDHEPFWAPDGGVSHHPGDQSHVAFLRDADLVIHDAQYADEEYGSKVGWGHSTVSYAVDVAQAAGARRLALFHHDPTHDDPAMERLEAFGRARAERFGGRLEVFAAAEGMELHVQGRRTSGPGGRVSALARRPIAGGRVLLVSANKTESTAIEDILASDDLDVVTARDRRAALARGAEAVPDLAIIDARLPDGDGVGLVGPLLELIGRPNFPVVLLTEPGTDAAALAVSDYLVKPFSPPMLHARVRAWLARNIDVASPQEPGHISREAAPLAREDYVAALGQFPLFRALSPGLLAHLVDGALDRAFPPGHVIIGEGEADDRVFVVLSGRVRVVESMPDAVTEAVLGGLGAGEIFGELAALTDRPRSATVIATERTHCLGIRHEHFLDAVATSPELSLRLLRLLARRLHDADRRLARYAPDTLTGLASRRAFHDQYRRLAAGARRRKTGVVLLFLDVCALRSVNDRYGYKTGDEVLRAVADALVESTRAADLIARYGGDEFAVLLVDAGLSEADRVLPRIGDKLQELARHRALTAPIQCRVGAAFRPEPPDSVEELLREADDDMRTGGRRVP